MRIAITEQERHTAGRQQLSEVMEDGLGHRQRALPHLGAQEQFGLGINRGPDPVGRPRKLLNRLGCTHVTLSHRTEDGVEFVELNLLDGHLVRRRNRL